MRRFLAGVALTAALFTTSASAQNWTGFYIGANTGVGWGDASSKNQPVDPASHLFFVSPLTFASGSFDTSVDQNGWVGGFQAGFNWQAGAFVWGVEADIQKSGISGSSSLRQSPPNLPVFSFDTNVDSNLNWFGTVRGRVGFLIAPNFLFYGTGGLAYGGIGNGGSVVLASSIQPASITASAGTFTMVCRTNAANPTSACYAGSGTETRIGWTAGLGGEWKLDSNWSVKFEYLRVELQGVSINLVSPSPPSTPGVNTNFIFGDQTYDIVRVGLNYTFN